MADTNAMSRFELKRVLEELRSVKGRNTELVSIYVPSGYNMQEIINMLAEEQSEAQNIKSKQTRKNVTAALEKIERRLKEDPHTPENGVALFAGNVSEREGKPDYELWEVVPPEPIGSRIYHCDKAFHLEPLEDMVIEKERFGIIILDKNNAVVASLRGKHTTIHAAMDSQVPGKTGQGGQCLHPETPVRMATGEEKNIKDIEPGDTVKALDIEKEKLIESTVTDAWTNNKKQLHRIKTENGQTITASADHDVFRKNNGIEQVPVKELNTGDPLFTPDQDTITPTAITDITRIPDTHRTIDISVKAGNFIANNLIVHNSAQRFSRIRKQMLKRFLNDIAEKAKAAFFDAYREGNLQGIIVAGPGFTKEKFVDDNYLHAELQDKVIAQIDTNYANEGALPEVMDKAADILEETAAAQERALVNTFFEHLKKDDGLATYGLRPVAKAIQMGAVDTLLLSEDVGMVEATVECSSCGHEQTEQVDTAEAENIECGECGSSTAVIEKKNLIDLYGRKAKNIDSTVEIISTNTAEGKRLKEMGGIAAILRYRIE